MDEITCVNIRGDKKSCYYKPAIGFWLEADNHDQLDSAINDLDKRIKNMMEQWQDNLNKNVEAKNVEVDW